MSDVALERRCRRVASAYPDGGRAEEVVTTLMESNAGRRGPRPGDVLNVLWHGLAARARSTAPGTRFGRWGDAASVVVVTLLVMQTTAAVAVTSRLLMPYGNQSLGTLFGGLGWVRYVTSDPRPYVAAVATGLAAAATVAACLGRVRAARALTVAAAAGGLAAVVVARSRPDALATFRSGWAMAVALIGMVVGGSVLFTGAVPRARRVVPPWWWSMAAMLCTVVAFRVVNIGSGPGQSGRMGTVLLIYAAQVIVLLFFAGPLLRTFPQLVAGLAMLLVPVTPLLAYGWRQATSPYSIPLYVLLVTAVAWPLIAAGVAVTVRLTPRSADDGT